VSLGYRHTPDPSKHEFAGELRFNRGANDGAAEYFRGGEGAAAEPYERNSMDAVRRELTATLDYFRPLGGAGKLEIGEKSTLRLIDTDFAVEQWADPGLPPAVRSNEFGYQQWIHAGYLTLGHQLGDLGLQGGVRVERTATEFDVTDGEAYADAYTSLFPSASALYSMSEATKLRFSYSRRIQRPHVQALNPFPMSDEPLNRFVGNPALRPEYMDALELSFQQTARFGALHLTPYYRRTSDAIRTIKTVSEDGVSTTTFRNLASAESYGTDLVVTGGLPKLRGMVSASIFRLMTDGSNVESGMASDAFTWNARANLTWSITPRLNAQYFLFHRAPLNLEQGRISSLTMSNVALQQKVLGDKGTVTLRVADPFDAMRMSFRTQDANHLQDSWRKPESRIVYLGFGYSFGRPPRIRRPQQQPQEEPGMDVRID
jgi:ferric enterobactin receptor